VCVCVFFFFFSCSLADVLCNAKQASGGYAFQPASLADALKLTELETLLSVWERPPKKEETRVMRYSFYKFQSRLSVSVMMCQYFGVVCTEFCLYDFLSSFLPWWTVSS